MLVPGIPDVSPFRVLLVEDNDGDARLVELMLRDAFGDVEVTRACTLAEGVASLDRGGWGCVLLDLGLPDASGLEVVERMAERAPNTPVVVLTGRAEAGIGVRAVASGAQDCLVKGKVVSETVGRAIRYAVARQQAEEAQLRGDQRLAEAQRIAHLGSWELDSDREDPVLAGALSPLRPRFRPDLRAGGASRPDPSRRPPRLACSPDRRHERP